MVSKTQRPIMITAGGTGGHVYPGLAVARALIAQGIPVVWMGTRKGLEARVIPAAGIEMAWLDVNGLRGKGWQTLSAGTSQPDPRLGAIGADHAPTSTRRCAGDGRICRRPRWSGGGADGQAGGHPRTECCRWFDQ